MIPPDEPEGVHEPAGHLRAVDGLKKEALSEAARRRDLSTLDLCH